MLVQVNTGNSVDGGEDMAAGIEARATERLSRHADRLTRVELFLEDVDGPRSGPDSIEARAEARPRGGDPLAVSARGADAEAAANAAIRKLGDALERHFGKLDAR